MTKVGVALVLVMVTALAGFALLAPGSRSSTRTGSDVSSSASATVSFDATATSFSGEGTRPPEGSPLPTSSFPGDPAIPVGPDAALGEPGFDEEAVRLYFAVHPPDYWDQSTPMPQVVSVEFLSTREAEDLLETSIPRPSDDLLCIVTLTGSFVPRIPPGVTPTYMSTPVGGVTVAVVIDALTGNIIGQGFVPGK